MSSTEPAENAHTDPYTDEIQATREYTHEEVLAGWRRHEKRRQDGTRVQMAKPSKRYADDSALAIRPADDGEDIDERMWAKVEEYLRHNPQHYLQRVPLLLELRECDPRFVFCFAVWYRHQPMLREFHMAEPGRVKDPEYLPMKLSEAVDLWNRRNVDRPITLAQAQRAARESLEEPARLVTWSPDGQKHTTLSYIRAWILSIPAPRGGKREGAGSGGPRPGAGRPRKNFHRFNADSTC